jgi:N-acetylmuramoyl-L-alanine amidase
VNYLLALLLSLVGIGEPPAAMPARGGDGAVTIPLDKAGSGPPLPAVTPARGDNPPLVVIDAGHGGKDPGATAPIGGTEEKDVTLALARSIRDELAASGRVRAALTREDDRFIPLADRYAIARRLGADLFILDPRRRRRLPTTPRAARRSTRCLKSRRTARRRLLAQQQNAADAIAGAAMSQDANVNLILIDLAQRESMDVSARFAQLLYREAAPLFPFQQDWHRFAAFVVLKAPDVPSVLFEAGYMSNPRMPAT